MMVNPDWMAKLKP